MDRVEGYVDPCQPEAVRLALHVVRDHFGEVPQKVCAVLLQRGALPLKEICLQSGLTKKETSSAVMVLVQHSFAAALLQEEVIGPRKLLTQYVYKADASRIVQALYLPKALMHVADTMGEWQERVVAILAENGRLTFQGIVQRLCASQADLSESAALAHVARSVVQLMHERFVEQAPPCDLPLTHAPDRRKAARRKKQKEDERDQLNAAHELTVLQYQKLRFKIPPEVITAHFAAAAAEGSADGGGAMDVDEGLPYEETDSVVLFRLNLDFFALVFRHQACVDMVTERYGLPSGQVIKAMLELSRPREDGPRDASSAYVTTAQIEERLKKNAEAGAGGADAAPAELPAVENVLVELMDAEVAVVQTNDDDMWSVCTASVISMVQFQIVSGHLKQRFGQRGLRIWRLLLIEHYLQADHIEKDAMINTRDVRKLIYAMLKAGYVDIQEVPKSTEHAPSKTIFTYGVIYFQTQTQLVADLYKSAGNLMERCRFELDREKTVLELAHRIKAGEPIKMSSAQLKTVTQLNKVVLALNVSLLRLADMLLIMSF